MEILISLNEFLWIVFKQKFFFWKRNLFLLPVIVVTSILLSKFNNNHEVTMTETTNLEKQEACQLYDQNNLANKTIYFTPNNKIIEDIMYKVRLTLRLDSQHIKAVENESKLQEIDDKSNDQVIIIIFDTALQPTNITYTIRVCRNETNMSEKYLKSDQDSYPESYDKTDLPYRGSGFLTLQLVIDAKIIDNFAKNRADFDISITKYPQLASARPIKIYIAPVAYSLVFILILFCVIAVLLDETRKFVYQELLKNNWPNRYLYGVINYVVDLMQITLMLIVFFAIFAICNGFGFINNIILLSITILFSMAILSYTLFLQAIFTSMTFAATNVIIWTLLCYLMPILIFQTCNWSFLEIFFPMNTFLRGMDLFEVSFNMEHRFIQDDILQLTLALVFCLVFYLLLVLLVINFGKIIKDVQRKLFKAKNKSVEISTENKLCLEIESTDVKNTNLTLEKIFSKLLAHQNDPSKSPNVPSDVQRALLICQNWMYLKSIRIILGLILFITICFLLIFLPKFSSKEKQLKKNTLNKIRDPIIMLMLQTPTDSPEMQKFIDLFQDNTERRHAKFEVHNNVTTENYIETIASTNITQYNENLVAVYGVSLDAYKKISIEILCFRNIVDSVSIALNLVSNVLVQYYSKENQTIDIMNAPISRGFRSAVYF